MKQILFYSICVLFSSFITAQNKKTNFENNLSTNSKVESFFMNQDRQTPSLIKIKSNSNLTIEGVPEFLKTALEINKTSFELNMSDKVISKNGSETIIFSASYNGVILEHAKYKAFVKDGRVKFITMEHYIIDDKMDQSISLTNDQARKFATNDVGAEIYVWDTINYLLSKTVNNAEVLALQAEYKEYFPVGKLVYVDDYTTPEADLKLAYKFNIYAAEPVYRANVFIDARSGKTLLADAIIKHADDINEKRALAKEKLIAARKAPVNGRTLSEGTGDTRYAGTRTFQTTFDDRGDSNQANDRYSLDGSIDLSPFGIVDNPATPNTNEALVLNETKSYDGVGGAPISINGIPSYSIFDGFARPGELQQVTEIGDNNFTAAEHYRNDFSLNYPMHNETNNDDIALDAHWGAEIVVKYWADIHARSSHDNRGKKIINYVHYGDAYDNAFWNGTAMTYGDGSYQGGTNPNGSFAPLTSLDVCGHEIGHGVCTATADLVYARESGAMNEGFSDIWAAAVENYVLTQIDGSLPYDPWGVGEQIDERDGGLEPGNAASAALRWMDDPNAAGNPSFYGGQDWAEPECGQPTLANDQCGVHNNSGVLNKWFYLMVTGSGKALSPGANKITADPSKADRGLGYDYFVEGLGFDIAEQVAFKAEVLLTANAKFAEMRNATILVAETEYSAYEVEQVTNAWYAVGVGAEYISPDPLLSNRGFDTSEFDVFPTIINSGKNINIINSKTAIETITIYSVSGKLVKSVELNKSFNVSLPITNLSAGMYFLNINGDKSNTFKFIVQ